MESVDISVRIIDPFYPSENWKVKREKFSPQYFDLSLNSGGNCAFGGLLDMLESTQGLIEFKPLYNVRKSSEKPNEPILWILNGADFLVESFPEKRPIKELYQQKRDKLNPLPSDNAVEPIIETLKKGTLRHNTMIISGQSFLLERYGLSLSDLDKFYLSLWMGKDNIESAINKLFKSHTLLFKELEDFDDRGKIFPVLARTSTGDLILENYII
ncbi:hypothetical protein [Okeania sp. SIO1I7]|uniref:hypothetical protein n=1 Tax=Okeania sp. SIO1I7 TaxID=2607772 RepID=UPI0013FC9ED8|nr:hypothetical protein [Okeania sp. SIO1I7]NET30202.1 hypothetical protein [Okeania sp. SIO1I7]